MRGVAINLTIAAAGVAATLVVFETVLASTPLGERYGWGRSRPLAERVEAGSGDPAALRWLGLGDSFAAFRERDGGNLFGVAAAQVTAAGRRVHLVNLAESATGLSRYIQNFQRFAPEVCPDLVLVALYLGNDVVDYKLSALERAAPAAEPPAVDRRWQRRVYAELEGRSLVLALAYRTLQVHLPLLRRGNLEGNLAYVRRVYGLEAAEAERRLGRADPDLLDRARADVVNSWDMALAVAEPNLYLDMLSLDEPTGHARAAREMLADLDRLATLVEEAAAKLVVVSIPPSAVVDLRYHDFYRRMGYRMDDELVRGESRLAARIGAHLGSRGVPQLDLTSDLRGAEGDVYLPDDIHLNLEGQRVAGLALAGLLERGLLERGAIACPRSETPRRD